MKRKKLCLIAPGKYSRGGIYTMVSYLFDELPQTEIDYVDCSREGTFVQKIRHFFISLSTLATLPQGPRVAYLHTAGDRVVVRDLVYYFIVYCRGWPLVVHLHSYRDDIFQRNSLWDHALLFLLRRAASTVTFNKNINASLHERNIRSTLVPNPAPPFRKKTYTTARDNCRLIFAGTLSRRKGLDLLAGMLGRCMKNHPDIKFTLSVFGEGDRLLLEPLRSLENRGLILEIQGYVANAKEYFCEYDFLILPSREEGMPMAIIESLSQCTRVIATNVGCITDITDDRELLFVGEPTELSLANTLETALTKQQPLDSQFHKWWVSRSPKTIADMIFPLLERNFK